MFYATQLLSKKGALGTIWIASHLEKRLKRAQIFETSIPASVDSIINPEAPLALRLSGQLLLGIVRVYLRKLEYLSKDAQSAVDNLNKSAAQGGANVDLEGEGRAAYGAITLLDTEAGTALDDAAFMFQGTSSGGALDSRAPFQPAYSHGDSLAPVEDVSELFGSRWALEDEKFEAAGDEIDRRFSIELERLRAEAAVPPPVPGDLFFQAPPEEDFVPVPDEMMEVPGDDLLAAAGATPAKTPVSAGGAPLPGTSDIQITPHSLGLDMLPDIGGEALLIGEAGVQGTPLSAGRRRQDAEAAAAAEEEAGAPSPAQQKRQQPQRRRKRMPQVDKDASGNPATSLPVKEIRALLADRAPLMTTRGMQRGRHAALQPGAFDVVAQSEEARHSALYRPGGFVVLAPELVELYSRAMGLGPGGPGTLATPRRRRAGAAAAEEPGATPRSPEGPPEEEGPGPATAGTDFSAGGFDFGAGLIPGDELGPPPAFPEEEAELPGLPEGPAWEEAGAVPGSTRRGSLGGLELVPLGAADGEEGEEGSEASGAAALPASSFTQRSQQVLGELRRRFLPASGAKRRHPSQGGLAAAPLSLDAVVAGKSRAEAARWFYEALVLRNNDFVELEQAEAYGDISIVARPKIAAGEEPSAC